MDTICKGIDDVKVAKDANVSYYVGCVSFCAGEGFMPYTPTQELSVDDEADLIVAGETTATHYTLNITNYGECYVRVCPVALLTGTCAEWAGDVYYTYVPNDVQNLHFTTDNTGTYYEMAWDKCDDADDYHIQVLYNDIVIRELYQTETKYTYTYENSIEDGGPYRLTTFRVKGRNIVGESFNWAEITGGNEAPPVILDVELYPVSGGCVITFTKPDDTDYKGIVVALDTYPEFVPHPSNFVFDGDTNTIMISFDGNHEPLDPDTIYYVRVAGYDAFGKTDLNWCDPKILRVGVAEITSAEILRKIRESLTEPGMKVEAGDLIFDANRLAIRIPGQEEPIYPFAYYNDPDNGALIALSGEILLNGNVSIDKLTTGYLREDVQMRIGGGRVVINGNGSIVVYDEVENVTNRNFLIITDAHISTFKYRNGEYHEYKHLSRVEYGECQSGSLVKLPGYWDSKPKVVVSPKVAQVYDANYYDHSQTLVVTVDELYELPLNSGEWWLRATCKLLLSDDVVYHEVNWYEKTDGSSVVAPKQKVSPNSDVSISYDTLGRHNSHSNVFFTQTGTIRLKASSTGDDGDWHTITEKGFSLRTISDRYAEPLTATLPPWAEWLTIEVEYEDGDDTFEVGEAITDIRTVVVEAPDIYFQYEYDYNGGTHYDHAYFDAIDFLPNERIIDVRATATYTRPSVCEDTEWHLDTTHSNVDYYRWKTSILSNAVVGFISTGYFEDQFINSTGMVEEPVVMEWAPLHSESRFNDVVVIRQSGDFCVCKEFKEYDGDTYTGNIHWYNASGKLSDIRANVVLEQTITSDEYISRDLSFIGFTEIKHSDEIREESTEPRIYLQVDGTVNYIAIGD